MTFTLRVLSCLLTGASGYVAPSVVVPPVAKPVVGALPPQPAIPSGGAPAQSPGAHARYAAAPTANAAVHRVPRTIDQPLRRRSAVDAEAKLTEIFSSTSPAAAAMYYESDVLQLPQVATGAPSVKALLDDMEAASSSPTSFDKSALVGEWRLEYTNDLPNDIREEVAKHVEDPVVGLSVVLSISDTGATSTRAVVTLLGGEEKVVQLHGLMTQVDRSPRFSVSGQGGESTSDITYMSDAFLIMRKGSSEDDKLGQLLQSSGVSVSPKTAVWKKLDQASVEAVAAPTSLWRFGLPYDKLRKEQIDAGMSQAFLSETGAATATASPIEGIRMLFGGLLLAAVTGMVAASRLWWSRAVAAGKPAVSATTAELQMSSVVDRAAASASSSSSWNPQAMVAAMGLLAGVAGGGQPALAADLENGESVFSGNCAACHAGGNNSVATEKKIKKPELEKYLAGGYNIEAIKYQVTNGKNSMPAFGERLGPDDIEDVATWVYEQAPKWS